MAGGAVTDPIWKELAEFQRQLRWRNRVLYRLFDDADELLYVGVTWNLRNRLQQHKWKKSWWPQVRRLWAEVYLTPEAVFVAERTAIQTENPRHNIRLRVS